MTADQLKDLITAGLACEHITLEGDGRHWYATIVSAEFEGKRAIQRHQRVYATLGAKMHTYWNSLFDSCWRIFHYRKRHF